MAKYLDRLRDPLRDLDRLCGSGGRSPNQGLDHATAAERERELESSHYGCRTLLGLAVIGVSLTLAFAAFARDMDPSAGNNGVTGRGAGGVSASAGSKHGSNGVDQRISNRIPEMRVVGKDGKVKGPPSSYPNSGGGGGLGGIGLGGRTGDSGRDW